MPRRIHIKQINNEMIKGHTNTGKKKEREREMLKLARRENISQQNSDQKT